MIRREEQRRRRRGRRHRRDLPRVPRRPPRPRPRAAAGHHRVIRRFRPDRVVAQSPERNWARIYASHPDHLAAGEAAVCAVYPDARNPFAFPELLAERGSSPTRSPRCGSWRPSAPTGSSMRPAPSRASWPPLRTRARSARASTCDDHGPAAGHGVAPASAGASPRVPGPSPSRGEHDVRHRLGSCSSTSPTRARGSSARCGLRTGGSCRVVRVDLGRPGSRSRLRSPHGWWWSWEARWGSTTTRFTRGWPPSGSCSRRRWPRRSRCSGSASAPSSWRSHSGRR